MAPVLGPPIVILEQASAYFQWINVAMDDAPLCRPPLLLNMDETAIVRHVSGVRGTVVKATSKTQVAIDRASLSDRRSCISLLASITNDASIQAQLRQVLLGNHHTLTLQVLRFIGERIGSLSLWRQKSASNSHSTMRRWLALLESFGASGQIRYVIVILDVHHPTTSIHFFCKARRCGVRLFTCRPHFCHLQACSAKLAE